MSARSRIGVGMLGYAGMGRAHANAYRVLDGLPARPPLRARLVAVAGRDGAAAADAADRYGFEHAVTDWREVVADERIGLFDNCGPNGLHREPTVAAAQAGKHVVCEKPLGRDADEAFEIWRRVAAAGVVHMCAFNYRFVPAVQLARELIAAGELGEIRHFRARYLQGWGAEAGPMTWRFDREQAGSGALGDLGAHVVDLAHHLVGGIETVDGLARTFVGERGGRAVDVDDAFTAGVAFASGAIGTLEASRVCLGRANQLTFAIDGAKGSIAFDLERLNELRVHLAGSRVGLAAEGFRDVLLTAPEHPSMAVWQPDERTLGPEDLFVHELHHLLSALGGQRDVRPLAADFEDGYRAAEVCDAIARAAASGVRQRVTYRSWGGRRQA